MACVLHVSTQNFFAGLESYNGRVYQYLFRSDQSALRILSNLSLLVNIGGPSPRGKYTIDTDI